MRQKWKPILQQWSEQGDTKLHFFAEKVLYNCLRSEHDPSLDEPIFILYDGSKNTDVFSFLFPHSSPANRGYRLRPRPAGEFLLDLDGPARDLRFPPYHVLARDVSPRLPRQSRRFPAGPHPLRQLPRANAEVLVAAPHAFHPGAGRRPPQTPGFRGDRRAAGDLRDAQSWGSDREGNAGG